MSRSVRKLTAALPLLLLASCARSRPPVLQAASPEASPGSPPVRQEIRITGLVQAVHAVKIVVPMIQGQYSMMTLTSLVPNGSHVKEGDLIATFDAAQQMDAARDARAKFEDLGHQVEQKIAENRANAERRLSDLRQAEADRDKAEIELKAKEALPVLQALQNQARAQGARVHLESLRKSIGSHEKAEAAALRILELQRDRQQIAMQRAEDNIRKLEIHASLAGMVAHEFTYRASSYGRAQVGDQLYRSYPLASIFDPSEMQVRCTVNEPDVLGLESGAPASIRLDAYPEVVLPAHLESISPVASSALGTPVRNFVAVFRIDRPDSHLLPDLAAAVVIPRRHGAASAAGGVQ